MKYLMTFLLASVFCALSAVALNPSLTYKYTPEKYNMPVTHHEVPTWDESATLNVWVVRPTGQSKGVVLISHNGDGNMGDYLRRLDQFTRLGYTAVSYDYRGYGESSEMPIEPSMYIYSEFTVDIESMINFCKKEFNEQELYLYGWGIGAGLSLGVGYPNKSVNAIIADEPFLSLKGIEGNPALLEKGIKVPSDYDHEYEPVVVVEKTVDQADKQILLMVGDQDPLLTVSDLEAFRKMDKRAMSSQLVVFENPEEKDNFKLDKAAYFRNIQDFLEKL